MRRFSLASFLAIAGLPLSLFAVDSARDAEWAHRTGLNLELLKGSRAADPQSIPGLVLWLDAAKGVAAGADGKVTSWQDQSGTLRRLSQDKAEFQPVLKAGVVNGLPVVRFVGEQNVAQGLTLPDLPLAGTSGLTLIAVVKQNKETIYATLCHYGPDNGIKGAGLGLNKFSGQVDKEYSQNLTSVASPLPGTGCHIVELWADAVSGMAELYFDGNRVGRLRHRFTLAARGLFLLGGYRVGATGNASGACMDLAELCAFDRPIAGAERLALVRRLRGKYGLDKAEGYVSPLASMLPYGYYPSCRELEAAFDLDAFCERAKIAREKLPPDTPAAEVLVYASHGTDPVASGKVPLNNQGRGQGRIKLPDLPDGEYRVEFRCAGTRLPATKTFNRKHFPFEGCNYGTQHKVYAPFKPVEIDGGTVKVVDRVYRVNALGVFDSVVSKGRELLAGPIELVIADQDGKEHRWPQRAAPSAKGVVRHPDMAEFEGEAAADGLRLIARTRIEEDGCARIDWTLQPADKPVVIHRAWLEIPYRDREAPLFHYVGNNSMRHHYAGQTPRGGKIAWHNQKENLQTWVPIDYEVQPGPDDGEIWNSWQIVPWGRQAGGGDWFREDTICYVWLGAEQRGLAWFADNLHEGVNPFEPWQRVVRAGDKVLLQVSLFTEPTLLDRPRHFTFGLQASPTKPLPQDWRSHEVPGGGGLTVVCWGGYYCSDKYPDGRDFSVVDKILDQHRTGTFDRPWWEKKDAGRVWKPLKVFGESPWVKSIEWFNNPACNATYYEEHVFHPRMEEWEIFRDEWSSVEFERFAYPGWPPKDIWPDKPTDAQKETIWTCGNAKPVAPSIQDFCLYYANEWLKRGVSLYFDNSFPVAAANPRINGFAGPDTTVWGYRTYYKRVWKRMQELQETGQAGRPLDFTGHVTNTQTIPMNTWFTATLDLEQPYRLDKQRRPLPASDKFWGTIQDGYHLPFPADYTRTMTLGRVAGVIPHGMYPLRNTMDYRDARYKNVPDRIKLSDWGMYRVHEIRGADWNFGETGARCSRLMKQFGYGAPGVQVFNYWDDRPILKTSDGRVKWLVLRRAEAPALLLVLQSYAEEPLAVKVALPGAVAAIDMLKPEEILSAGSEGELSISLGADYGTRLLLAAERSESLRNWTAK
ncbi:MAG: glycoside hydrolase domain-containing protein [Thermoguttaceae bacterium]|jgi:hypothetical protein